MSAAERDKNYELLLERLREGMYVVGNKYGQEVDRKLNVVIKLPGADPKQTFREVDRIVAEEGYGITYESLSSEEEYMKLIAELLDKLSADGKYVVEFDWLFDVFIQESFRGGMQLRRVIKCYGLIKDAGKITKIFNIPNSANLKMEKYTEYQLGLSIIM